MFFLNILQQKKNSEKQILKHYPPKKILRKQSLKYVFYIT